MYSSLISVNISHPILTIRRISIYLTSLFSIFNIILTFPLDETKKILEEHDEEKTEEEEKTQEEHNDQTGLISHIFSFRRKKQ